MKAAVTLLSALARFKDSVHFVELTFLDGLVDAYDILPHDTTCAYIEMPCDCASECSREELMTRIYVPDFGVAHEPFVETNCNTMRIERTDAMIFRDRVHIRSVARCDSVAFHVLLGSDTPAIVNATRGIGVR